MIKSTRIKFHLLILLCSFLCCSQSNSTNSILPENNEDERQSVLTTFPKEQYLQDFDQLVNLLSENHPQLNEYISKDDFDTYVNELRAEITDEFKIGEFIWLCRSLVAKIGCGHSNVPTLGANYYIPDSLLFPLKVNFVDNKLFVIDPMESKDLISKGDEIKTINGLDVKEIKKEIFKHISADANSESKRMEYINDGFYEYVAFELKFPNSYKIEYIKNGNLISNSLKPLQSYTEEETNDSKCDGDLCYESENNLAIITISSFYYYSENFSTFQKFIDSCFTDIKDRQIKNLIIDLRNNGGGDPYCGSYLLQHIASKKYQYYKTGTYSYEDLQEEIEPHPNRFNGTPYILINGRCGSTSGHVCALIKENNFGIFVGQETGATFTCNASTRTFTLENTSVTTFIATRTFEANVKHLPKDRGVIPDIEIKYAISNLLNKEDLELQHCKSIINKKDE